jgi:hypothetical protein
MSFKVEGASMRRRSWILAVTLTSVFILLASNPCSADDGVPPQVDRLRPPDDANVSPGRHVIELNFTEAMNQTSVENSVVITPDAGYTSRFWTVDGASYFFRVTFEAGRTYHLTLLDTAKDINETLIESSYTWSYRTREDGETSGLDLPWWLNVLLSAMPMVLIFAAYFLYEWNKKRKLTDEQREKLKALQSKKLDTYDKVVLALFVVVLVATGLIFAFGWIELSFIVGALALLVGLLAFFGFISGASSLSSSRKFVEMSEQVFTDAQWRTYEWEERVKSIKQTIIVLLILTAMFSTVPVITALKLRGDAFSMLSGFLYTVPIFVVLIAFYYYFSRRRAPGTQE